MGIKVHKPTSAGRRKHSVNDYHELSDKKRRPYKPLLEPIKKTGGRNHSGKITSWQRGGGNKRMYRKIDFKRNKDGIAGTIERIEYDPNRTAHIALVLYADGERRYIIAPKGLRAGDKVISGREASIKPGNCLPLRNMPMGSVVHCVEMKPGKGAQLARSAGSQVVLAAREGGMAHLRLPSGEVRLVRQNCYATVGQVGNLDHEKVSYGKAGASRWRGRRPHVRGVAMNPVDHPMGGGEGRSSGGQIGRAHV